MLDFKRKKKRARKNCKKIDANLPYIEELESSKKIHQIQCMTSEMTDSRCWTYQYECHMKVKVPINHLPMTGSRSFHHVNHGFVRAFDDICSSEKREQYKLQKNQRSKYAIFIEELKSSGKIYQSELMLMLQIYLFHKSCKKAIFHGKPKPVSSILG